MEKVLTAKEAREIALSKSEEVRIVFDFCLAHIKREAEKGKFSCMIMAECTEATKRAMHKLDDLGYVCAYVSDDRKSGITIHW